MNNDEQSVFNKYNELYYAAEQADKEYVKAIREQFGPKATRWDYKVKDYNEETMSAYLKKIQADDFKYKFLLGEHHEQ